jgi:hypothetical protein
VHHVAKMSVVGYEVISSTGCELTLASSRIEATVGAAGTAAAWWIARWRSGGGMTRNRWLARSHREARVYHAKALRPACWGDCSKVETQSRNYSSALSSTSAPYSLTHQGQECLSFLHLFLHPSQRIATMAGRFVRASKYRVFTPGFSSAYSTNNRNQAMSSARERRR